MGALYQVYAASVLCAKKKNGLGPIGGGSGLQVDMFAVTGHPFSWHAVILAPYSRVIMATDFNVVV